MIIRTISGLLGGVIVVIVLMFNGTMPFLLNCAVATVCALACYEFFSVMNLHKTAIAVVPSLIFSALLPVLGSGLVWQGAWLGWYAGRGALFSSGSFAGRGAPG